jgi:hypothetical protein
MRALTAEYDVCGTQVYSALLTDTAISIWNSAVGYGNVISTEQLPMFQNKLPPNSRQLGTATRLCITITKMTAKCSRL